MLLNSQARESRAHLQAFDWSIGLGGACLVGIHALTSNVAQPLYASSRATIQFHRDVKLWGSDRHVQSQHAMRCCQPRSPLRYFPTSKHTRNLLGLAKVGFEDQPL